MAVESSITSAVVLAVVVEYCVLFVDAVIEVVGVVVVGKVLRRYFGNNNRPGSIFWFFL